ncbi:MAG: hypothetical protein M3Z08_08730, partial [Chloroflexota bacterium]|nr:hypothetical protein [Chloroflexota bacterium]
MQPDLKYGMPLADSHEQSENEYTALRAEKERGRYELHPPHQQNRLNQRWRRRPSPTMWHLILLLGDGIVLLALLELLLPPPPHVGLAVSGDGLGPWSTHFAWLGLALASWCCAVNIMQAQKLSCAASLLKSPLYILGSLALMLVFCILFLYLAIGNEVISYTSPLLLFL